MVEVVKNSIAKKNYKRAVITSIVASAVIGSSAWYVNTNHQKINIPSYEVERVIDGDTFETKEGIRIRLYAENAPEMGRCGSEEAKNLLTNLISNKKLSLKVMYIDEYRRLESYVYSQDGFVNEMMLKSGWTRIDKRDDSESNVINPAGEYAQSKSLGIYSKQCLSNEPEKPNCLIKGNVRHGREAMIYTLPGCQTYDVTVVQKDQGDMWFCTEAEAKKAGFVRSGNCHDSIK